MEPKLKPEIVTDVPIGPAVGERLVIPGPEPTTNSTPLLGVPLTVTTTFPVVAPLGTGAWIVVEFQAVGAAATPLNVTVLDPCEEPKFMPEIVTELPTAPDCGFRLVMAEDDPTTNSTPLLENPFTVTMTFPVVAPTGTVTAMLEAPQLVEFAGVPLNVTNPGTDPKLVPVIVTGVPAEPEVVERLEMVGVGSVTEKLKGLLACPATVTITFPVVAPLGTGATMLAGPHDVGVAVTPLNVTVLDPCVEPKFAPLIVTEVPTLAELGLMPVIPGPEPTTRIGPLLARPPTVTTTGPVVAPLGTGTLMLVEAQVVGVPTTPLNVIVLVP